MESIGKYKNNSLNKVYVVMIKHTHTHMPYVSYKQRVMENGHHRRVGLFRRFLGDKLKDHCNKRYNSRTHLEDRRRKKLEPIKKDREMRHPQIIVEVGER